MQLLAILSQQTGVCRVLQQGVLEDVGRVRYDAMSVDELSRFQLVQCLVETRPWQRIDCRQHGMRELATDCGGDLRDALHVRLAVQALPDPLTESAAWPAMVTVGSLRSSLAVRLIVTRSPVRA